MKEFIILCVLVLPFQLFSQQVADTSYKPDIKKPEYEQGKGPVVFIDEGHHNFHTKSGRYKAFADLLERDGYTVTAYTGEFKMEELKKGKILVISNALNEINVSGWHLPTPSAFTKTEIEIVKKWVEDGGSLFLIADHMPMAGAASDLAAAFGFEFTNGFVFHTVTEGTGYFKLNDTTLTETVITRGRNKDEHVSQITTFTGQGFKIPGDAVSVVTFNDKYYNLLPDTAWAFNDNTPRKDVKGWSQLAYKMLTDLHSEAFLVSEALVKEMAKEYNTDEHGKNSKRKGRVVISGEAAMFSAQLAGSTRSKVGMNSDKAPENYKLLLNIIHWLDGRIPD